MDYGRGRSVHWGLRAAAFLLGAALVVAVQRAVFLYLPVAGAYPDLTVLAAGLIGLLRGRRWGAGVGFALGTLADVQAGWLLGAHGVSAALGGFLAGWASEKVFRDSVLVPVTVVAGVSVVCHLAYTAIANAFGLYFPWRLGLLEMALPTAAYNAFLAALLWPLCLRWHRDRFLEDPPPTVRGGGR